MTKTVVLEETFNSCGTVNFADRLSLASQKQRRQN